MNKLEELGDSVETHQDGLHSLLNSFQFKTGLNSSRVEKCDQSTWTDKMVCNCDCDVIPKLKEKAHKSFMQVIQIETLYKEEIEELKSHYEESLKNNDKKFKIKEDLINEKCNELESEIDKMRQHYESIKSEQVANIQQNPFDLSNFSNFDISQCFPPDESSESILNIKEFIKMPKLKENVDELRGDINSAMVKVEGSIKLFENDQSGISSELIRLEEGVAKMFMFLNEMIENTVNAHEKINDLIVTSTEAENRYSKVLNLLEGSQKESKFMTEHIKRISQDKIKMEKKNMELERINKSLEQSVELLKKALVSKAHTHQRNRLNLNKDEEMLQSYKLLDDEEEESNSKNYLFLSLKNKNLMTKSVEGSTMEKMVPKGLCFKNKEKFDKSKQ